MVRERSTIGSRCLFILFLSALALPAWGGTPNIGPAVKLLPVNIVTSVSATAPLESSGGTTPNISLTGTVPVANGGTGTTTGLTGVQKKIGKVAIVAQSGGDYTSPVTAMANISTGDNWCGTPSASNPCLVKIMPGVYALGSGHLDMQEYVDFEGSGEEVTVITGAFPSPTTSDTLGLVNGASNAEIRFLTVNNAINSDNPVAAIANRLASPKITHVTATASGGFGGSTGVFNYSSSPNMSNVIATANGCCGNGGGHGVYNDSSSPNMSNVTAKAIGIDGSSNYGMINSSSSPTMSNVTATASGGASAWGMLNGNGSSTLADRSTFYGGGAGDSGSVVNSNSTLKIGSSKLSGLVIGTVTCVASYNGDYVALGNNCQ